LNDCWVIALLVYLGPLGAPWVLLGGEAISEKINNGRCPAHVACSPAWASCCNPRPACRRALQVVLLDGLDE